MLAQQTPGVYVHWLDNRNRNLAALRTDIAAFIGIAERGPVQTPTKVESWVQFTSIFGGHIPQGYLAYAVEGFFENGGRTCWIVRVARNEPSAIDAASSAKALLKVGNEYGLIEASSPGSWGQQLLLTCRRKGDGRFDLTVQLPSGIQEVWRNLTLTAEENGRFIQTLFNHPTNGSQLLQATRETASLTFDRRLPLLDMSEQRVAQQWLSGGSDGLTGLTVTHFTGRSTGLDYEWGLQTLEVIDEIGLVAIPDLMPKDEQLPLPTPKRPVRCDNLSTTDPPAASEPGLTFPPAFNVEEQREIVEQLIQHCQKMRDRVAIVDMPPHLQKPMAMRAWRNQFDSAFMAVYTPWLKVPDPTRLDGKLLRSVPPSGAVTGIYARSDTHTGVYKAPANEPLYGVKDLQLIINDVYHGELNQAGVNVIRPYNGLQFRIVGARTMSSDPEWRYINVRRLVNMIAESLESQMQWTVFEPNSPALWRDMDRIVRTFLDQLWQAGYLEGATADDAFFVRCDDTTNPPYEKDQGRVICEIGLQPPIPAEFVIVKIGRTEGGIELLETNTA
ncbi:MAG: phage tail sheath C-terminal domain-containing protein [Chloroflexota bacterium]